MSGKEGERVHEVDAARLATETAQAADELYNNLRAYMKKYKKGALTHRELSEIVHQIEEWKRKLAAAFTQSPDLADKYAETARKLDDLYRWFTDLKRRSASVQCIEKDPKRGSS